MFRYPRYSRSTGVGFYAVILLVLGILAFGGYWIALKNSERIVTFTVLGKDSVTVSRGEGEVDNEYRVYTNKGTFKVTDSLVYGNFRAADRYGQLREDHTYTCKVAGWRVGLFSWFPNLINCHETLWVDFSSGIATCKVKRNNVWEKCRFIPGKWTPE